LGQSALIPATAYRTLPRAARQPRHAQPAAAVAARAGDIEVQDLGPEIGQRVLHCRGRLEFGEGIG